MVNIDKLIGYFEQLTRGKQIEDLPIKIIIQTADISDFDHPQLIVNSTGSLAKIAVLSSIVPPLFPPYRQGTRLYVDGGYLSLYAAKQLKDLGAEVIVGLYPDALQYTQIFSLAQGVVQLIKSLMSAREAYERNDQPIDLEIRGFEVKAGLADFAKARQMYQAGLKRVEREIPRIKALLHRP